MMLGDIVLYSLSCGIWIASATKRDTDGLSRAIYYSAAAFMLLRAIERMVNP